MDISGAQRVKRAANRFFGRRRWTDIAEGERGIRQVGHRAYVGGMWDEIGRLQLEFMVKQGLRPQHVLLDIGCGSLRGGVHFIRYLDRGNYLGIDKEKMLLEAGLAYELPPEVRVQKVPELIVSSEFEFDRFGKTADFALAQSLFTHLPDRLIHRCLRNLRKEVRFGCRFFASYFVSEAPVVNPSTPHDHVAFRYSVGQIRSFGERNGWQFRFLGDWGHPRGQMMAEYTAR